MILSIQYLRAIAAIGVVFAHTVGFWGEQGVDIFFAISGYIMMYLISTREKNAGAFFLARFFRIAPLYYLLTAVAIVVGCAYEPTLAHIIQSALFIKYQWTAPVLPVGWTLDYEFIFYTLCALSLAITKNVKHVAIIVSIALFIGTFVLDFVMYPDKKYGHFIEFWYGIAIFFFIAYVQSKAGFLKVKKLPQLKPALILIITTACALSVLSVYTHDANGKAYLRFVMYGIPAALLILTSVLYEKIYGLRKNNALMLLGAASYSIYLSHTITLFFFYEWIETNKGQNLALDLLALVTAVIVGVITYTVIEKPLYIKTHHFVQRLCSR